MKRFLLHSLQWGVSLVQVALLGAFYFLAAMVGMYVILYILPRLFVAFVLATGKDS